MSFDAEAKAKIVSDYARSENDTGSPEVQVALLTGRIPLLEYNNASLKKDPRSDAPVIILKKGKGKIIEKIFLDAAKKNVRHIELFNSKGSIMYAAAFNGIRKISKFR